MQAALPEFPVDEKIDKAVALNFDPEERTIPAISATGKGALARRIVDLAFEHGVKVREDPDLVEVLMALEIGERVPAVAFAAIAEILVHVYRWELVEQERLMRGFQAEAAT
jgi:flagellar biosynthesis protein